MRRFPQLAKSSLSILCSLMGLMPALFSGCEYGGANVMHQAICSSTPTTAIPPGCIDKTAEKTSETGTGAESYEPVVDNSFLVTTQQPLSTFSIDVDTASYSNVRRFLNEDKLPPKDAVRIEELVNYFDYDYPSPESEHPVAVAAEVGTCPWNHEHRLVRIGVQGKCIEASKLPPRNLVFLIDVSGSMNEPNKLPLVKRSLEMLVEQLREKDRIAMVTYAGNAGLVLPSTRGSEKGKILKAIEKLESAGSTNGGAGIQTAYNQAKEHFDSAGVNRVILATDGDFNVGVTSKEELLRLIEEKRKSGVFLTVLGYGMGNLKDATLEKLADHGNGHYAYIDSVVEARKVFVEEGAALVTVAKDVKLQVEFNPRRVASYRLIGYENRLLQHHEFNDDKKDAGDMGAGHKVTALYELVPAGTSDAPSVDPLKYQDANHPSPAADSRELLTVKIRYKEPTKETSKLMSQPVVDEMSAREPSVDFRFAAAVAAFGMILRDSPHKGDATFDKVLELARGARGKDVHEHRAEFVHLVEDARKLVEDRPIRVTSFRGLRVKY